jgi:hypothetical protein
MEEPLARRWVPNAGARFRRGVAWMCDAVPRPCCTAQRSATRTRAKFPQQDVQTEGFIMKLEAISSGVAMIVSCSNAFADDSSKSCDAYLGAWEYIAPTPPGRFVFVKLASGKYFGAWVTQPMTDAKADAVPSPAAAEATCRGSEVHWKLQYAPTPGALKAWVQDATVEGDVVRFWTVRANGSRTDEGKARRIR